MAEQSRLRRLVLVEPMVPVPAPRDRLRWPRLAAMREVVRAALVRRRGSGPDGTGKRVELPPIRWEL